MNLSSVFFDYPISSSEENSGTFLTNPEAFSANVPTTLSPGKYSTSIVSISPHKKV